LPPRNANKIAENDAQNAAANKTISTVITSAVMPAIVVMMQSAATLATAKIDTVSPYAFDLRSEESLPRRDWCWV